MSFPIIVAEMACAHQGECSKVLALIDAAAAAGVDVVQFQFFKTEENAIEGTSNFALGKQLEIDAKHFAEIFAHARKVKLKIWATVADVASAQAVRPLKPDMWRIHSSDINNLGLIECLCQTAIPLSFSVGGSTLEEIEFAIKKVLELGGEVWSLTHGFQGYPTPIEEANLAFVKTLKSEFGLETGYQDHTDGDDPLGFVLPAMALSYGATIIEKHFTLDRSKRDIDHHASLNPDELKRFTDQIRRAATALGKGGVREFGPSEAQYRTNFKKGLIFRKSLESGHTLTALDLKMVRTEGLEIYGNQLEKLLGKQLKKAVRQNDIVTWDAVV